MMMMEEGVGAAGLSRGLNSAIRCCPRQLSTTSLDSQHCCSVHIRFKGLLVNEIVASLINVRAHGLTVLVVD